jgi:hypothetical protein
VASVAVVGLFILARPAFAQFGSTQQITSAGPLTRIIVSADLSCQVAHREDAQFEFFPSESELGDCGTYLATGGTIHGPAGGSATSIPWEPVSQTPVSGAGTAADPLRVVTTVEIAAAGLRLQQTDSYVVGSQSYRTDVQVTNTSNAIQTGAVYRAGDCYLQGDDAGFARVDGGAPACIVDPALGQRIEQWTPITAGSHYYAGFYTSVWALIGGQEQFPDQCECAEQFAFDNGAGLSWPLNVAPAQTLTFTHETFFSPVGRAAPTSSYTASVPDPTQISLDPVVVAQSVIIAAGVVLLVPFPSALFNSTLEENYPAVMGGIARMSAWLSRQWRLVLAWIRRQIAARRTASPSQAASPGANAKPSVAAAVPVPTVPAQSTASAAPAGARTLPAPPPPAAGAVAPRSDRPRRPAPPPPPPPAGPDIWRTPQGMLVFVLISGLLYAFLDPTFGLSLRSLATYIGLVIGLLVVLLTYGLPLVYFAQNRRLRLTIRALPVTVLVGIGCVLISRLANFQPGYLYGLIVAFMFAGVTFDHEGPARATAAAISLGAAFVAWVTLAFIRSAPIAADPFLGPLISAATVTVVVAGVESAVFALLPLRFMAGSAVFNWNRRVWAVLIGLGVLAFAHVLLNPTSGYMADSTRTDFLTMVVLLIGFAVASVLFWAYFRFRPAHHS